MNNFIRRLVIVMLIVLAWSILAFCSKNNDATEAGSSEAIEARHDNYNFAEAVCRGDLERVKTLLKDHPWLVSIDNIRGPTPLLLAVKCGERNVVELLIANNADVKAKTINGWTPLHLAAQKGRSDMAELLLNKGAIIDAKDSLGLTPLHWAAAQGHKDVAVLLLANKAEVNAKDAYGYTPLHWAAEAGCKDVSELLLGKGAEINAKSNGKGRMPFGIASVNDDYAVVQSLRVMNGGFAPLHLAAREGHADLVELLLAKGAETNVENNDGKTPMKVAAEKGHKDVIKLLRQHGGHE
jgi:ankyrin repeat protein